MVSFFATAGLASTRVGLLSIGFDAFARAIKEALQTRFPEYAEKIKEEVRVRIANFPLERSLRQINAETIGNITSVSGMVVRASEVKPLAKELIFTCPDEHITK